MAEAMTVETILEADWLLQGFWTKPRFPFQTASGQWSDVDVLAYHPEEQHLVVSESKVSAGKKDVFAYTAQTESRYGDIVKFDGTNRYFGFLRHVGIVCGDGVVFRDFRRMVKTLTVQLVSNYFVADDVKSSAIKRMRQDIAGVPEGVELNVCIETTFDVICRIIRTENQSQMGRRYGHPVIDIVREINRYMHPQICYAGRDTHELEEQIAKKLREALGSSSASDPRSSGELEALC